MRGPVKAVIYLTAAGSEYEMRLYMRCWHIAQPWHGKASF
jgi:hypothetical protein